MKLNGTTITGYTKSPYRPDTTTGVLCDAIKTLEALKKVNPNIEGMIHFAGFVLLMALMVFVFMNDIKRL